MFTFMDYVRILRLRLERKNMSTDEMKDNLLGVPKADDEVFYDAIEKAYYTERDSVILGDRDLDRASKWQRVTPAAAISLLVTDEAITAVITDAVAYVGFLI